MQISEWAKAAGIPLIFIGYPFSREHFGVANRAAAEVAAATGAYYLPTDAAFSRVSGDGGCSCAAVIWRLRCTPKSRA